MTTDADRRALKVRALAKINVSLRVGRVRDDGYHELSTVFQSIALHDTLAFRRTADRFRLRCDDPDCPSDETNLIWKAAALAWTAAGRAGDPSGIVVSVTKR